MVTYRYGYLRPLNREIYPGDSKRASCRGRGRAGNVSGVQLHPSGPSGTFAHAAARDANSVRRCQVTSNGRGYPISPSSLRSVPRPIWKFSIFRVTLKYSSNTRHEKIRPSFVLGVYVEQFNVASRFRDGNATNDALYRAKFVDAQVYRSHPFG